ncbi:MAG: hypothetical protein Q9217_000443 [Psora testacea]
MQAATNKFRQLMQENSPERETRSEGHFRETEARLPYFLGSRFKLPLVDNISSYLGARNPLAKQVDPRTESVWLLDNTAYRPVHPYPHKPQPFQAEFVAAYFQKNTGKDISKAVADIADKIGLKAQGGDEKEGERRIAERLQHFMDTIAPARLVTIEFPNGRKRKLGPGGRSAVSMETIVGLGEHKDGESIKIHTIPPELLPHGPMTTYFADPDGWLVISDIDDTIKRTMTPSPIGILQTTFVDEPEPIPGMPELYAEVTSSLNPNWFYLSASPYNLYPFLRKFVHEHYPLGPLILREASWMNVGGFLASLTQGTEAYKQSRMDKIHGWFPRRKVLCVGDSTQSDPEAYGDICRKYKGWIKAVFIRKVVDVAEMNNTDKNTDERFQKAFKDVDPGIWKTFVDPRELVDAVAKLKAT